MFGFVVRCIVVIDAECVICVYFEVGVVVCWRMVGYMTY